MADHPQIFSAPMVRALLEGRKTQTRRALKLQPPAGSRYSGIHCASYEPNTHIFNGPKGPFRIRPRIDEGDRLYVREHWRCGVAFDDMAPRDMSLSAVGEHMHFEADTPKGMRPCFPLGRHRQGRHMPRWASRITLTVTEVRVQRLQDISEADAVAEGCFKGRASRRVFASQAAMHLGGDEWRCARDWYADLWDSLNAKRDGGIYAWDRNPWVTATTFTVEKINIDKRNS